MAEHSTNLYHCFLLENANIVSNKSKIHDSVIQEATETELKPRNMNTVDEL
jgi:hypothetical protein